MADHGSGNSIGSVGTIITFLFAGIGVFDLNKVAAVIAILAGISTITANYIRARKDLKK